MYPAFRRYDAKNWSRWKFYPWPLICFTRSVLFGLTVLILAISIRILSIGHNFKKGPIPNGCRKSTISAMYRIACATTLFIGGMGTEVV